MLVTSTKFNDIYKEEDALRLMETCITLLTTLIQDADHRGVSQGLDYTRKRVGRAGEDGVAKAIWALGYNAWRAPGHLSATANDLFHQIFVPHTMTSPRAGSYCVMGCCAQDSVLSERGARQGFALSGRRFSSGRYGVGLGSTLLSQAGG